MSSLFRRAAVLILACGGIVHAGQRTYVVGTTVDLMVGSNNNQNVAGFSTTGPNRPLSFSYGAYPSLTLTSAGSRSALSASYALGLDRTNSSPDVNSVSHSATARYSRLLGPKWNLGVTESFEVTTDATSFNAARGVTPTPGEFDFPFYPTALRISSRSNSFSVVGDHAITATSSISVNGSHSVRSYGEPPSSLGRGITGQQRFSGSVAYRQQSTERESWSLTYTGSFMKFEQFDNSRYHSGGVGYSNQLTPDLNFQLSVGASHVSSLGASGSYIGYNTSASLQRTIQSNTILVHYTQSSGEPTGLGSTSDRRTGGVTVGHRDSISSLSGDVSIFDSRGTLDNPLNMRGVSATGSVGLPLTPKWTVQGNVQYQRNSGASAFEFTQKRIFVSLRFNEPNLWRFSR